MTCIHSHKRGRQQSKGRSVSEQRSMVGARNTKTTENKRRTTKNSNLVPSTHLEVLGRSAQGDLAVELLVDEKDNTAGDGGDTVTHVGKERASKEAWPEKRDNMHGK